MNFDYSHPNLMSKYAADYESFSNKNYPHLGEARLINYNDISSQLLQRFEPIPMIDYDLSKLAQISEKLYDIESFLKIDDSNTLFEKMQKLNNLPLNHQVKQFVKKLNLDYRSLEGLENFLTELHQFMNQVDIEYEIKDTIFIDPDYPDWQEIKFSIILNKSLDYILKDIKPVVYKMADKMTPLANDKIMIVFKSR